VEEGKGKAVPGVEDIGQVVAIAWSSNGSSLAAAYGKTDHTAWCEHHSTVSVWGIFRRDFDPKKPAVNIEVNVRSGVDSLELPDCT